MPTTAKAAPEVDASDATTTLLSSSPPYAAKGFMELFLSHLSACHLLTLLRW
jgi:hypothetical protein